MGTGIGALEFVDIEEPESMHDEIMPAPDAA
jgi:hypothetical protein